MVRLTSEGRGGRDQLFPGGHEAAGAVDVPEINGVSAQHWALKAPRGSTLAPLEPPAIALTELEILGRRVRQGTEIFQRRGPTCMMIQFHGVELNGGVLGAMGPVPNAPDRIYQGVERGVMREMTELQAQVPGQLPE